MAKNLIIYYSRKGENYCSGKIVDLKKGNTARVAEFIQKAVGGDLFEVETVKTYPADYTECTEQAQAELRKICKGATVKRGLSIRGCKAEQSEAQAAQWAKQSI